MDEKEIEIPSGLLAAATKVKHMSTREIYNFIVSIYKQGFLDGYKSEDLVIMDEANARKEGILQ